MENTKINGSHYIIGTAVMGAIGIASLFATHQVYERLHPINALHRPSERFVSLDQLLKNPQQFVGKKVEVKGYPEIIGTGIIDEDFTLEACNIYELHTRPMLNYPSMTLIEKQEEGKHILPDAEDNIRTLYSTLVEVECVVATDKKGKYMLVSCEKEKDPVKTRDIELTCNLF